MAEDYIKRSDALKFSVSIVGKLFSEEFDIKQEFQKIPSADVVEVKHGKWQTVNIFSKKGCGERYYYHKECSTELYKSPYNFCPNCGADMREES